METALLEKNSACYVCGPENAAGMRLQFEHVAPFTAETTLVAFAQHEGWQGLMHGGVTFTLMDEAFGWCLLFEGIHAVTAKVETRFLKPIPTGTELRVRAFVIADRKRLLEAEAEVTALDDEGIVYASATATMMRRAGGTEQ
ncbi:MAG TPA: PaaI family thioesterase [Terriglobus sp.]